MTPVPIGQTNRLLGYPDDARLLIINADDFGMCHAINTAIWQTLQEGVVASTSLMVPCPWALHAMELLKTKPDISFSIHLTVICDQPNYKWTPLTSKEKVPSLVVENGHCYPTKRMAEFAAQANIHELETEFRAQIQVVLDEGLKPTHLDWHCLHNGGRPDIFDMTFGLAREYGLALRVSPETYTAHVQAKGLPANDYPLLDSYRVDVPTKAAIYTRLLRELPVGLNEWAVHPGLDTGEMQAVEPDSWQIRWSDYGFMMSAEARDIIAQEGIILLDYKPLQTFWQGH